MLLSCDSDHDPHYDPSPETVHCAWKLLNGGASEREFDSYVRKNPSLLALLISNVGTGHAGIQIFSQQNVRQSVRGLQRGQVPDYLVSARNSEGRSWWLIELKSPTTKVFAGSGQRARLSEAANIGVTQLLSYWEHCVRNQSALATLLGLSNFAFPNAVLVIGREQEFEDSTERARLKRAWNRNAHNVSIRTYDSFFRGWEDELESRKSTA